MDNHCAKYKYPRLKLKEEFALRAVDKSYVWVIMTFDSNVISATKNLRSNQHTIINYCAKYENPPSKIKEKFALRTVNKF